MFMAEEQPLAPQSEGDCPAASSTPGTLAAEPIASSLFSFFVMAFSMFFFNVVIHRPPVRALFWCLGLMKC